MSEEIEQMESMADFSEEIEKSMKKYTEGDLVKATVVSVSVENITVDLGTYAAGIVKPEEFSNDPNFQVAEEIKVGDVVSLIVIDSDDGEGNVLLSLKQAAEVLAWDDLKEGFENQTKYSVKILQSVNGGVIAYLKGIRGFIPASLLSIEYVENVDDWVGETVEVIISTVDQGKEKLVLSAKAVEKEKRDLELNRKRNSLQKGLVTKGVIERIESYGCFVNIGNGLTGLVHISQICGKFIKSPNEVVKLGEEVNVMVLDVADGKIKLSMKAVNDISPVVEEIEEAPVEYHSDEEASTSLGSLLAGIKLD